MGSEVHGVVQMLVAIRYLGDEGLLRSHDAVSTWQKLADTGRGRGENPPSLRYDDM